MGEEEADAIGWSKWTLRKGNDVLCRRFSFEDAGVAWDFLALLGVQVRPQAEACSIRARAGEVLVELRVPEDGAPPSALLHLASALEQMAENAVRTPLVPASRCP